MQQQKTEYSGMKCTEPQREKQIGKQKRNRASDLLDNIKGFNICVTAVLEEKRMCAEKIF